MYSYSIRGIEYFWKFSMDFFRENHRKKGQKEISFSWRLRYCILLYYHFSYILMHKLLLLLLVSDHHNDWSHVSYRPFFPIFFSNWSMLEFQALKPEKKLEFTYIVNIFLENWLWQQQNFVSRWTLFSDHIFYRNFWVNPHFIRDEKVRLNCYNSIGICGVFFLSAAKAP